MLTIYDPIKLNDNTNTAVSDGPTLSSIKCHFPWHTVLESVTRRKSKGIQEDAAFLQGFSFWTKGTWENSCKLLGYLTC